MNELGLRLDDFLDMQLNEFLIKAEGYNRMRDREMLDRKFLAYHSMVGSHLDPKKIPTFEKFIAKESKSKLSATEEQKAELLRQAEEYYKKISEGVKDGISSSYSS